MVPPDLTSFSNNVTMNEIPIQSVPPGFVSLTSFTLKRVVNSEQARDPMEVENEVGPVSEQIDDSQSIVDFARLKRALRHKPWILPYEPCHVSEKSVSPYKMEVPLRPCLPKGVIRGCSSCGNSLKVMSSWRPEESHLPVLEGVPVFHPTDEEFKDALTYVASIRTEAERYGICRIVPPASYKPPCCLKEKNVWRSLKFTTRAQRVDELANLCSKSKCSGADEKCKRRKVWNGSLECGISEKPPANAAEGGSEAKSCSCGSGKEYTLETFEKFADDFQSQYFGTNADPTKSTRFKGPSAANVEGAYWRTIEKPDSEIEVLFASGDEASCLGKGFPVESNSENRPQYHEYLKSDWNLNVTPNLQGSLLRLESSDTSASLVPQLFIGMCFSSFCWNTEKHNLYSLCYSHMGAPRVWYCIPWRYRFKFEDFVRKHFAEFSEHPAMFHKHVPQLSPSTLTAEGIPVYRCVQHPREFILVFPGVYHGGFTCGFNCSESVNFAPFEWLPHGQNAVELYSEQCRKTSISHDKIMLGAAMRAVKAQWEHWVRKDSLDDDKWRGACGKEDILAKALKERIRQEGLRRKFLCRSSQSRKMDDDFGSAAKKECCICFFDLYLSAAGCSCSPGKYTCLRHSKFLCSCAQSSRFFLFRYEMDELETLAEGLERKTSSVLKWGREVLGLSMPSPLSKSGPEVEKGISEHESRLEEDPISLPNGHPEAPDVKPDTPVKTLPDKSSGQNAGNCTNRNTRNVSGTNIAENLPCNQQPIIILSDNDDDE